GEGVARAAAEALRGVLRLREVRGVPGRGDQPGALSGVGVWLQDPQGLRPTTTRLRRLLRLQAEPPGRAEKGHRAVSELRRLGQDPAGYRPHLAHGTHQEEQHRPSCDRFLQLVRVRQSHFSPECHFSMLNPFG
ncbi:unnamed protein product, partial [Effrenium voratum]